MMFEEYKQKYDLFLDGIKELVQLVVKDKRVQRISFYASDSFYGYYLRAYDSGGREIYTITCDLSTIIPKMETYEIDEIRDWIVDWSNYVSIDFHETIADLIESSGFMYLEGTCEYIRIKPSFS